MANVILPSDKTKRLRRKFGESFPDLDELEKLPPEKRGELWRGWIEKQIESQQETVTAKRAHYVRHRLFRWGHQWISTRDGRKWREVNANEQRIRRTFNIIGPALDFRLSLVAEQRPGWQYEPIPGLGVSGREIAEAQQSTVEWHWKTQQLWRLFLLAGADAQTDGVSFLQVYIDKNDGPLIERVQTISRDDPRYASLASAGYKRGSSGLIVPISAGGEVLEAGETSSFPGGMIRTRRLLASQTWADPEAETISGPNKPARWFMVREPRDIYAARLETGNDKLEPEDDASQTTQYDYSLDTTAMRWANGLPPFPWNRVREEGEKVWDTTVYLAPDHEDLGQDGLFVRLLGCHEHKKGKLPKGVIPIARITDGSTDPELYPRPVMSDWINEQITVNALGSKIIEFVRMHTGTRLMALKDTLIEETFSNIVGSIIEYQGQRPTELANARVNPDLWNMFMQSVRRLEDMAGFNDIARGQVAGDVQSGFQDVSGRAVLGAREMFERQFGPMIRAMADGATDWAALLIKYAQYLYTVPRLIPMAGRPDLAKRISTENLEGDPCVFIDPETLMPMPRALKNQMLIDHFKQGIIGPQEYRKRSPYAEIRNLTFGDTDQWNRAQWVNTVLEERFEELVKMEAVELYGPASGLAIYWQDDPNVHLQALDELILDDRKPFDLRKLAADRWGIYAELQRSKSFPMELEIQGMQRPPAPFEVLGVPNMVPQQPAPGGQARPTTRSQVPGNSGQPATSPAPLLSPAGLPSGAQASAKPLGALER